MRILTLYLFVSLLILSIDAKATNRDNPSKATITEHNDYCPLANAIGHRARNSNLGDEFSNRDSCIFESCIDLKSYKRDKSNNYCLPLDSTNNTLKVFIPSTKSIENDEFSNLLHDAISTKTDFQNILEVIFLGDSYIISDPLKLPSGISKNFAKIIIRGKEPHGTILNSSQLLNNGWKHLSKKIIQSNYNNIQLTQNIVFGSTGSPLVKARHPNNKYFTTGKIPLFSGLEKILSAKIYKQIIKEDSRLVLSLADDFNISIEKLVSYSGFSENEIRDGITIDDIRKRTFLSEKNSISKHWNFSKIECVFLNAFRSPRARILRVTKSQYIPDKDIVVLMNKVHDPFNGFLSTITDNDTRSKKHIGFRYFCENDIAMLDSPGEWISDQQSGTIQYHLEDDQFISAAGTLYSEKGKFNIIIPYKFSEAQSTLTIGENETNREHNIHLEKLIIKHTSWTHSSSNHYIGAQSLSPPHITDYFLKAAVTLYCDYCTIEKSNISSTGGHGLLIYGNHNLVKGDFLTQIGGNGIIAGDRYSGNASTSTHSNRFYDNTLTNIGTIHYEGTGILLYKTHHNIISNNSLQNIAYNGISTGWSWDINTSSGNNNKVKLNKIESPLMRLNDGAGIYNSGPQKNMLIDKNLIINIGGETPHLVNTAIHAVFLDRASKGITISNNYIQLPYKKAFNHRYYKHLTKNNSEFKNHFNVTNDGFFVYNWGPR